MSNVIDVAAGVLINSNNQVLIAQRPVGKHMAGFWEFPGGKFEAGESASQALYRELEEELGVQISGSEPLITLVHHYPDRSVRLHVRVVREWLGEPKSLDQQALSWVSRESLPTANLLPADAPIVNAILLPATYAISPQCDENMPMSVLDSHLERWQSQGVKMVQWRQAGFASTDSEPTLANQAQAERVAVWAKSRGVIALLNCDLPSSSQRSWASRLGFAGIHLKAHHLAQGLNSESLKARANAEGLMRVSVACHSVIELQRATEQECDLAILGPVNPTASHPGEPGMGWEKFSEASGRAGLPVYAVGGCLLSDIKQAKQLGAQGVAGIRGFWPV